MNPGLRTDDLVGALVRGESPRKPSIVLGDRRWPLPAATERRWGAALSRVTPRNLWQIDRVLDEFARPDIALHGVVEVLRPGGRIELTTRNTAFVDDAVALVGGRWPPYGTNRPFRFFTAESLTELAEACGIRVDSITQVAAPPTDAERVAELFGPEGGDRRHLLTLHGVRSARGDIPVPNVYGSVDDVDCAPRPSDTCHDHDAELLAGRRRVVVIDPAPGTTRRLAALGHTVTVIDPLVPSKERQYAARVAVRDPNSACWSNSLEGQADAVLLGDVLGRVTDPVALIRSAHRCLDPSNDNASVVIAVPNVAHADIRIALASGRWTTRDNGILDRTRLHHFTPATLEQLVRDADSAVVEQRATLIKRGSSSDAEPGDKRAPKAWRAACDLDPTASLRTLTWALAPRRLRRSGHGASSARTALG